MIILDTTAFYAGIPFQSSEQFVTTDLVYQEVYRIPTLNKKIEPLIDTKRIIITNPEKEYFTRTKQNAMKTEGMKTPSNADLSIIALALQQKENGKNVIIITDDYAVQNIATNMNIDIKTAMYREIKNSGRWLVYCPGCGNNITKEMKSVETNLKNTNCDTCGTKLRQKLIK
jgi:UPF0271 protein|tara:strand:- start:651 stop:1166 length:516 start_codon:yes stop_codon:yes gene_type:complete